MFVIKFFLIFALCSASALSALVPLHRYARSIYDHFYTTSANEIGTITPRSTGRLNYVYEGVACKIYDSPEPKSADLVPLYQYIHSRGNRFYTTAWRDIGTVTVGVTINSWTLEGIAGYIYSSKQPNTVPFHRYYSSEKVVHFYTTNVCEIGTVVSGVVGKFGYKYEGVAGYVVSDNPASSYPTTC